MADTPITVALVSVEGSETDRIVWPNIYFDTTTLTVRGDDVQWAGPTTPPVGKYDRYRVYDTHGQLWVEQPMPPIEVGNDWIATCSVTLTGIALPVARINAEGWFCIGPVI